MSTFFDDAEPQFLAFIDELQAISRKYGVAVSGHFDITLDPEEFKDLKYDRDVSSRDIRSYNYWE